MNVSLTPELEKFVQQKVASGKYNSASELVREALRLIEERDEQRELRKAAMDKYIQEGLDSAREIRHLSPKEHEADERAFWEEIDTIIDAAERTNAPK